MADQFDDTPEFSMRDVMDTVRRRKWVVIQAFIFVTVIGVVTAWLSPPVYSTSAKLLVDTPTNASIQVVKANAENPLTPLMDMRTRQNVATQLAIMRSGEFLRRVAKAVPPGDFAGVSLAFDAQDQTSIVTIGAEGSNPAAVARTANGAAAAYVGLTDETNKAVIENLKKFLKTSVDKSKKELDKAEKLLMDFKQKTGAVEGNEMATTIMQDYLEAARLYRTSQNQLLSYDSKIATLRQRLAHLPATIKEKKVGANPEVEAVRMKIAELKAQRAVLLGQYQPGSAKIVDIEEQIKQLEDVKKELKPSVEDEFDKPNPDRITLQAQLDEQSLQRDALKREADQQKITAQTKQQEASRVAPEGVKLAALQRDVDLSNKAYQEYEAQLRDVTVRGLAGSEATTRILEEAYVPVVPIRPQKAQQVALAMVMGLMLGIGFAFLQEFLDDRVNSSEDIQRVVALPTLGMVPTIGEGTNCLLIGQDAFSPVTESYRSLRTSVQYSALDKKVHLIGVTSAHPGEGKSVTSANLAIAMALQGKRVILVDADLRRPSTHRLFGVESEPGLTSVLAGELTLDEALRKTAIEDLQILTSGPLPPNPPELLNSQVMLDLMEELKTQADVIIFDTPPVVPVTDAQVLGSYLDGMILVVESGQARKAAVKHARELLDRTHVRILGVVLNKIDQSGKGYYYQYYHSGYSSRGDSSTYRPLGKPLGNTPAEQDGAAATAEKPALSDKLRDWE